MSVCSNRRYLGDTWNKLQKTNSTFILGRTSTKANQVSGLTNSIVRNCSLFDDTCLVALHMSYVWYMWNVMKPYVCDMICLCYYMWIIWYLLGYYLWMVWYMLWYDMFWRYDAYCGMLYDMTRAWYDMVSWETWYIL